jgi:hypothetical protein
MAATGSIFVAEQALGAKAMHRIVERRATHAAAKIGPSQMDAVKMTGELRRRSGAMRAASLALAPPRSRSF